MADSATIDLPAIRSAMRAAGLCPPAMPFLGVFETFEARAANVVFIIPAGPKRQPGAAWDAVRLFDGGTNFLPVRTHELDQPARITKLEDFGVRVGWIPDQHAIFFQAHDSIRLGFARTIDGKRWIWRSSGTPALEAINVVKPLWPSVLEAAHRANRRIEFVSRAIGRGRRP